MDLGKQCRKERRIILTSETHISLHVGLIHECYFRSSFGMGWYVFSIISLPQILILRHWNWMLLPFWHICCSRYLYNVYCISAAMHIRTSYLCLYSRLWFFASLTSVFLKKCLVNQLRSTPSLVINFFRWQLFCCYFTSAMITERFILHLHFCTTHTRK